jgi:hypothetical protein
MKYLKHTSETFAKTPEKHLKTIVNIRNIQLKHLHHMCENIRNIQLNILATYVGKNR